MKKVVTYLISLQIWNILLLSLTFFITCCVPFFPKAWHGHFYSLSFSFIFIVAALCVSKNNISLLYIAIIALLLEWITEIFHLPLLHKISIIWNIIFFIYIIGHLISMIARAKQVNRNVILEAINAYLLMGLGFALIIAIMILYYPDAISFRGLDTSGKTGVNFSEYLYYSFVTLSTLGYGDIVPTEPLSKSLATLISITGQLYLAIIIAMLVGKFSAGVSKDDSDQ